MTSNAFRRTSRFARILAAGSLLTIVTPALLLAQAGAASPPTSNPQKQTDIALNNGAVDAASNAKLREFALKLWQDAKSQKETAVRAYLDDADPTGSPLAQSIASLDKTLDEREQTRASKIADVDKKLTEKLSQETTPKGLSEALKQAVEMYVLVEDKPALMREARIVKLVEEAERAAHDAEAKEDWFLANELFYRLHVLMEESGKYKPDVERLGLRLAMMRMYVPESFWKLRNDQRLEEKKSPLPPYNGLGENYHDRLKGIDKMTVMRAIWSASRQHIDARKTGLRDLMIAGIDSIRTMVTTSDLKSAFPSIGEESRRVMMVTFLDLQQRRLEDPKTVVSGSSLSDLIDDMIEMSGKSVQIPDTAILHEFGNGAMGRLDDFSSIIWPDEVARFDRMTSGVFVGIGVQIQVDDETQMIKVVTPIEGTPAQRAGVRTGDLIKKIDGQSAVGISINQAVDLITGPPGSKVNIVMERDGADVAFDLPRDTIEQASVKGWRRSGIDEKNWDWYIDPANGIGYVRILGFSQKTTIELREAIEKMKEGNGLHGLIVDLRFNPGGLLTEAVSVSNLFIDKGTIVSTTAPVDPNTLLSIGGGDSRSAEEGQSLLKNVPVAVLINEGSASASEIVSGAVRFYADKGEIDAILVGQRTFGKGSVQNVWGLRNDGKAKMRLTTQYYMIPDGRIIHRMPGASVWGVDPHLSVDMLPQQITDALKLRQDADVVPTDANGKVIEKADHPVPEQLLTKGLDPQLQWALVLLQAKAVASAEPVAEGHALKAQ